MEVAEDSVMEIVEVIVIVMVSIAVAEDLEVAMVVMVVLVVAVTVEDLVVDAVGALELALVVRVCGTQIGQPVLRITRKSMCGIL